MRIRWLSVFVALILAAVVHLAAVLALPFLATKDGWARLADLGDVNRLVVLPAAGPEQQSLPFMAPDVRYAVCRYELSDGPVRLVFPRLEELWMIAFYTPQGENFYAISGGDLRRDRIEVIVSTQAETLLELEAEVTEETENIVIVKAPQDSGLAIVRAPLRSASFSAQTEEALNRASCAPREQSPLLSSPGLPERRGG